VQALTAAPTQATSVAQSINAGINEKETESFYIINEFRNGHP